MSTAEKIAAIEARGSSNHSSPTYPTREVPTVGESACQTDKIPEQFMLITRLANKDDAETPVKPGIMEYLGESLDSNVTHTVWTHYEYKGDDARLSGQYFLYAIRGKTFYCRHVSLMSEYRGRWMAVGAQKLRYSERDGGS